MKTNLSHLAHLLLFSFSIVSYQVCSQSVITSWDFQNSNTTPNVGSGSTQIWGNLNSSFPTSTYGKCWQVTNFANQSVLNATRGIGYSVNTTGYGGISLSFSQRATGPASRWARLDYSLDGGLNWVNNFWVNAGGYHLKIHGKIIPSTLVRLLEQITILIFRCVSFPYLALLHLMSRTKLVLFHQTQLT